MTHPDGSRSAEHGRVLAGVKAMPFGWPTASLDPDSGRDPPARSGSPAAEFGGGLKRQKWVFTVSGDCHLRSCPRCRAIALIVQPWLRSAVASTSFSHVSIAVGSFERSSDLAITSVEGAR